MHIIYQTDNSWVAVPEDSAIREFSENAAERYLVDCLQQAQRWLCDLDDTHAPSPAKKIAARAIGAREKPFKYALWAAQTAFSLATQGKEAQGDCWREYVAAFILTEFEVNYDALDQITAMYDETTAREEMFQGVEAFYQELEGKSRAYVTRNLREAAQAFAEQLGIQEIHDQTLSKFNVAYDDVQRNPHIRLYGVDGDSTEDGDMIDALKKHKRQVTGLYVMKEPRARDFDERFTLATSPDRSALVEILRKQR